MELPSSVMSQGTEIGVARSIVETGTVRCVSFSRRVQSSIAFNLPVGSKRVHRFALWGVILTKFQGRLLDGRKYLVVQLFVHTSLVPGRLI